MKPELSYSGRVNLLAGAWGAAAVVVQTEFLRAVMASSAGGTLGLGAVLGVWLAGIALGAPAGGRLARGSGDCLPLAETLTMLAPLAALFGLFYLASIRTVAAIPPGELIPLSTLVLHGGAACLPFALIIGIGFPVLARMASSHDIASHDPAALFIGGIWAGEAAGAFCGGVAFTFLLAGLSSPALNVLLFSALPLAATWLLPGSRTIPLKAVKLLSTIVFTGLIIFGGSLGKFHDRICWQGTSAPGNPIESRWTRYGYLSLAGLSGQTTLYENGQPAANFPDPWSDAATAALLLSQHPLPSRILVIGPAAYGPVQALLACGAQQVTSVYPDRGLERMLTRNLPVAMLEPLRHGYAYVAADPRSWLRRQFSTGTETEPAGWDLVWLNLDGPLQMNSSRYYTPSFFRLARRAFSPAGGALALRFPFSANSAHPAQWDLAAAIIASLKTEFPHFQVALSMTHCHVFASDRESILSGDLELLMGRAARFEGKIPGLSRYLLSDFYDRGRIGDFHQSLGIAMGSAQPHTDNTPSAWFHYLRIWCRISGSRSQAGARTGWLEQALDFTGELSSGRAIAFFPLSISCLLLLLWLRIQAVGRAGAGTVSSLVVITVAATGFAAMEVTVSLIYLCQILFGALFYQVAIISSTFMLALAAGSWWSSSRVPPDHALPSGLVALLLVAAAAAATPEVIASLAEVLFQSQSGWGQAMLSGIFYFSLILTGLACGAIFPWAAAVFSRSRGTATLGATAASLDAADHAGAALAAAVVGTLLIPALGLRVASLGTGLMVCCVALFWYALACRW